MRDQSRRYSPDGRRSVTGQGSMSFRSVAWRRVPKESPSGFFFADQSQEDEHHERHDQFPCASERSIASCRFFEGTVHAGIRSLSGLPAGASGSTSLPLPLATRLDRGLLLGPAAVGQGRQGPRTPSTLTPPAGPHAQVPSSLWRDLTCGPALDKIPPREEEGFSALRPPQSQGP